MGGWGLLEVGVPGGGAWGCWGLWELVPEVSGTGGPRSGHWEAEGGCWLLWPGVPEGGGLQGEEHVQGSPSEGG